MSETTQQTQTEIEANNPVKIPVKNACPECGEEIFGHGGDAQDGFWQPETIDGKIAAYRTDDDEIAYKIAFDCQECGHEFRERGLTNDDIEVVKGDE